MVSSIGMRPRKVGFSVDSPLEGDGFEPSVPREDEPRKGAVDPLTPADSKAPHHDRPAARKADSNSSVAGHRELRFSRQGGAGAAASVYPGLLIIMPISPEGPGTPLR